MLKINKTIGSCPTVVTQSVLRTHYNGVIPVSQEKSTNIEWGRFSYHEWIKATLREEIFVTRKFFSSVLTAIGQVNGIFYLLFEYLTAIFGPLLWGQLHSNKVNHWILVNVWLEGYLVPCNKQCLIPIPKPGWVSVGIWNQNLLIQSLHCKTLQK